MKKILTIIISGLVLIAGLVLAAPAQAATPNLPDIYMSRLRDFRIEQASNGEKRLRFTTVMANKGPGRFEARLQRPNTSTSQMTVQQRVYNTDGTSQYRDIPGTHAFWGGDGHSHWHVYKLQRFTIHKLNADGSESASLASGAKTGFCFYDNTKFDLAIPGAPQTPYYTGCGTTSSLSVRVGLSVGWADTYGASLNRQWIKINGLPDGKYRVRVYADPSHWFTDKTTTNNGTRADIEITGNTVTVISP